MIEVNEVTRDLTERILKACNMGHDVELHDDYIVVLDEGYDQTFEISKRDKVVERQGIGYVRLNVPIAEYTVTRFVLDHGNRDAPPCWDECDGMWFNTFGGAMQYLIGFMVNSRINNAMLCWDEEKGDEYWDDKASDRADEAT